VPYRLVPSAGRKAPQDRAAVLWTRSEPCSGRFTAVPSKNPSDGSMPCIAMSTAWTFSGGRGPLCVRTGVPPAWTVRPSTEVQRGRRLCPRTAGDLCQRETQTRGQELDHPIYLRVDHSARCLPSYRKRAQGDGACQPVNDVGKPCAGELHARFEAAGTGNGASATAPVPDPTQAAVVVRSCGFGSGGSSSARRRWSSA
jgi:hypothetical protein